MDFLGFLDYRKSLEKRDEICNNLHKRSLNIPASSFKWSNPVEADGIPILARTKLTASDPNIMVTYNNFATIQRKKAGYFASNIQRVYADDISDDLKDKYKTFDNLNHTRKLWKSNGFKNAGWGTTYTLCYLDELKQIRIKPIEAWNAKVIYDDNGEPIKGFVYYTEDKKEYIYEYDDINVTKWVKSKNGESFQILESATIHGFTKMPLVEWANNDNKQGNAEIAVTLLDAYDLLTSDNITESATFRQAYLMLKNVGVINDDVKAEMQKTGIFNVDGENSEIKFITKNINADFVKYLVDLTWENIWITANSVDTKALSKMTDARVFQLEQMYSSMDEDCNDTELEWVMSFEYLDRVLKSYWTGLDPQSVADYSTEDISYEFVRNKPKDNLTWLKDVLASGDKLDQKTILTIAGFEEAQAEEIIEQYKEESVEYMPELTLGE